MRWELAKGPQMCGCCSALIRAQEPILRVSAAYLVRCTACAKARYHTEPPVLDRTITRAPEPPLVFSTPARWAKDYKLAQAGEK